MSPAGGRGGPGKSSGQLLPERSVEAGQALTGPGIDVTSVTFTGQAVQAAVTSSMLPDGHQYLVKKQPGASFQPIVKKYPTAWWGTGTA